MVKSLDFIVFSSARISWWWRRWIVTKRFVFLWRTDSGSPAIHSRRSPGLGSSQVCYASLKSSFMPPNSKEVCSNANPFFEIGPMVSHVHDKTNNCLIKVHSKRAWIIGCSSQLLHRSILACLQRLKVDCLSTWEEFSLPGSNYKLLLMWMPTLYCYCYARPSLAELRWNGDSCTVFFNLVGKQSEHVYVF